MEIAVKEMVCPGCVAALDPAEPHFSQTDPVVRLDPTDAIFVDVIHTDATPFIKGGEVTAPPTCSLLVRTTQYITRRISSRGHTNKI